MNRILVLLLLVARSFVNLTLKLRGRKVRVERILFGIDVVVRGKSASRQALFLHRAAPLLWAPSDPRFKDHSIDWESTELSRQIVARGFEIHAASGWSSLLDRYVPPSALDLIFDENGNLPLFQQYLKPGALKILYLTGSYPRFQNLAETARVDALWKRRGMSYYPKRMVRADLFDVALQIADLCLLVGNDVTISTYPEHLRSKLISTTISASPTVKKSPDRFVPDEREFLWFFGQGAVHKGLDLAIEVFARHPEWVLNIVGPVDGEADFCQIYQRELAMKNIRMHGFLRATDEPFARIVDRCVAFIAPTCSEGISPAVATTLQAGLYPIISRNTGVTLPDGAGLELKTCGIEEIEAAVRSVFERSADQLRAEIGICKSFADAEYSREHYSHCVTKFFEKAGLYE